MALECIACLKPVARDGRVMACAECSHVYHLGQCSGIADSTFTTMGLAKREKWRCRTCRAGESRSGSNDGSQAESSVSSQLAVLNAKIDSLMQIKESVDSLLVLPGRVEELMSLKPTVQLLQSTVSEVQTAVEFLSKKYDTVLSNVTANDKKLKELQGETASLKATVMEQCSVIKHLQSEMNEAEQYNRLQNLEISGMPVLANENLNRRVGELAESLGISDFRSSDILAVHRLPAKGDKIPTVLIRFSSPVIRDKFTSRRSKLRSLVEAGNIPKMFLNENLTRTNKELFWRARCKASDKGYRFVWVKNGKIFAKKEVGSSLIRVLQEGDLAKLV